MAKAEYEIPAAVWGGASERGIHFDFFIQVGCGVVNVQVSGIDIDPIELLAGRIPGRTFAKRGLGVEQELGGGKLH